MRGGQPEASSRRKQPSNYSLGYVQGLFSLTALVSYNNLDNTVTNPSAQARGTIWLLAADLLSASTSSQKLELNHAHPAQIRVDSAAGDVGVVLSCPPGCKGDGPRLL